MTKPTFKTILICIGLFFFFLLWNFPYGNLKGYVFEKIYKTTKIFITAQDMSPSLLGWPGISLKNVEVSLPLDRNGTLDLSSKKLVVRAGIGSLWPFGPSVSLYFQDLREGGDLYLKLTQSDPNLGISLQSDEFELNQLKIPNFSNIVSGAVTAEGEIAFNKENWNRSSGYAEVDAEKIVFAAQNFHGIVLPSLVLGEMVVQASINEGIVQISNFQFGGPDSDLSGTVSGEINLGKQLSDTFIDVTIRCKLSEKYKKNPQSDTVVASLRPYRSNKDTGYAMRWSATVQQMKSNIFKALPSRVSN